MSDSGRIVGYRGMWQRLRQDHNLVIGKETVRLVLRIVDPEEVKRRSKNRLRRRNYRGRGSNYIWHVDGYDKLKPFCFRIHGCIDGYSRRILWLEMRTTNNDPRVTEKYFLDCVHSAGCVSRIVRGDNGTENVNMAAIQR